MSLGMDLSGVIGISVELFLFYITFKLIKWWKSLKVQNASVFPRTLNWIYVITNIKSFKRNRNNTLMGDEAGRLADDVGEEFTDQEKYEFEARTNKLFNEDGSIKSQYKNDPRYKPLLQNWYQFAKNEEKNGYLFTTQQRNAINYYREYYENDDDDVDKNKVDTKSHTHDHDKINNKKKGDDTKNDE